MRVARAGQGALHIPYHIFDRPVLFARDRPQRPPVKLLRFEPDSVKQHGGRHVVRVRDERHAHPGTDRLILEVQAAGVPASPEREYEGPGYGHAKGHRQNE
jgi:hypothetical protein